MAVVAIAIVVVVAIAVVKHFYSLSFSHNTHTHTHKRILLFASFKFIRVIAFYHHQHIGGAVCVCCGAHNLDPFFSSRIFTTLASLHFAFTPMSRFFSIPFHYFHISHFLLYKVFYFAVRPRAAMQNILKISNSLCTHFFQFFSPSKCQCLFLIFVHFSYTIQLRNIKIHMEQIPLLK